MQDLFNTEIWNDRTLADLLTLEFLASIAGSILGATLILIIGVMVARIVRNRVVGIGLRYQRLDDTLFSFLGDTARYAILAFTGLFVLNTFGVETTSVIAVIGAAGLASGLPSRARCRMSPQA